MAPHVCLTTVQAASADTQSTAQPVQGAAAALAILIKHLILACAA